SLTCHAAHHTLRPFPTRRSSDLYASTPSLPVIQKPKAMWPRGARERKRKSSDSETRERRASELRSAPVARRDTLPRDRAYIQSRSEEHTSELQSLAYLVCRLLLE